jgi:hypothetical protein
MEAWITVRIDWQDVVAYAPEVLVVMPCSLQLERVAAEFGLLHPERFSEPIPSHQALKVSSDGQRLEPYQ